MTIGHQPIANSQQPIANSPFRSNGAIKSRLGPEGTVWCPRCRDYLPPEAFGWDTHAGRPDRYCREHRNAYAAEQFRRQGQDGAWWQHSLALGRARYARSAKRRQQSRRAEQGELARVFLGWLRSRGLTLMDVERLCGIGRKTQRQIEAGADVTYSDIVQRLAWARLACRDLPPLTRGPGSRQHPSLPLISARYRWLADGA